MRRALLALALLALALLPVRARAEADRHSVTYFYRNYCEACAPEEDFAEEFRALTGLSLSECDFTGWNVVRSDGQAALDAALAEHGLASASLPMVIVDGAVYQGAAEMNADLARAALSWRATNDSEILYLYVPACESCARAEAALDALPDSVTLKRGDQTLESRVTVRRVDVSADPGYADALFEAYDVPDAQRVTPIAFFADRYLAGAEAIEARLGESVRLGWAAGGVPQVAAESAAARAGSLAQTVGAGLVAGLNTCALSMLLLFLSLALEAGRRAALPVLCFLAAKFACYLLIGFAFLKLFQRFDPAWLRPLARWVMTIVGAALVVLNLSDALHAWRKDFGGIRNQLPGGLRGGLRRIIQRLARRQVLIPAATALGFIVAGGEFLCAGQLYLMRLLADVQSGQGGQALRLVAYCLAFLLPSAVVSGLVLGGKSQARAAAFFADHMALIKLLTALAMLALMITAWALA